jgi:hypothetical protein
MRRSRLVDLYPRAWRDRYGAELLALLEERPPSARDRLDVLRGALDARVHPQLAGPAAPEPLDEAVANSRRAGRFTLAGAIAWVAGMVVALNGPIVREAWGTYRDGGGGLPFIILAMALLTVGLAGTAERLPAGDRLGRAGAWVAGGGGLLWAMAPWVMITGLVGAIGFVFLAAAAVRAGQWSIWGVAVGLAALAALPLALLDLVPVQGAFGPDGQYAVLGALVVLWLVVAGPLVTRPAPIGRPAA